ncbi:MAG TPA: hypothetical protein VF908_02990 [Gemmatimonadaceae bacterium]
MLVGNSSPDAASRAAIRLLMDWLPGSSVVEGSADLDLSSRAEQPQLISADIVEGRSLRAIRVPGVTRTMVSEFGAFLDGIQRVRVIGRRFGVPLVLGTTGAAVRVRVNRRLVTWGHHAPKLEQKLYLPFRYLPTLAETLRAGSPGKYDRFQVVDTSLPDASGAYPSEHPTVLLERAIRAVDRERDALEDGLAEAWCAVGGTPLFIDGGITRSERVASSENAIGVIKSHFTLYVEGEALKTVIGLAKGERSSVFQVTPKSRTAVMSWYLRLRDPEGHDALWGLVRIEMAKCDKSTERADEISRWVLAEASPLALPDGRWDKMSYGIRDVEEFLRAIS